jgi:hypothetical protein
MGENPLRLVKTTPDIVGDRIRQLEEWLPECVAEGVANFDRLRAALGDLADMLRRAR